VLGPQELADQFGNPNRLVVLDPMGGVEILN
jgi:hypothetical protein